ncbi:insulin-like growth factor-binding protein-like 1 [Rhinatrema bivittatum]|uniref:insulin-like growth factor-binding protein-like 1 n=1 Tax=Rhinatrema bivittatum TaxID=194408 RepID=UPI0011290833|nr:insulin-like growth factor-binding protein-like 1 [Rhinatrema bivittatum]XP_029459207.1 insulin-like growth factor-binding protein-like 1 [Rhinatrema bivittatum]
MYFLVRLSSLLLALQQSTVVTADCGACKLQSCEPVICRAPELLVRDDCGCCEQCLSTEGEPCGGKTERRARCGPGLVCVSQSQGRDEGSQPEGTGICVCKEDGLVCGSDGRSYRSGCALHLQSWVALHAGKDKLHKVHDGACTFAPVFNVIPKKIHNVTGTQVYLSCEVKAIPTPVITWRKVTESPKGSKLLEELPGDRVNVAIQVRGGPSKHESTGWVLINPLMKEDEGIYQCHATNMVGEAHADGMIKVTEQSKTQRTSDKALDGEM